MADRTGVFTDGHGRTVNYLRLSVTDRCNLRCSYCHQAGMTYLPHDSILSYEEFLALIDAAVTLGVTKVRLTGGEPFARRDFPEFVEAVLARHPALRLCLTTNATLLEGKLPRLYRSGVRRINISLDTLDPETYRRITGRDFFDRVLGAIDEALGLGFQVKVNAVAIRGVNDRELPAFVRFAAGRPLDMRFIELMPVGCASQWDGRGGFTAEEILREAGRLVDLVPAGPACADSGPARTFAIRGGQGRLGVISAVSSHFCGTCNRLRITAAGNLRTCLFSDRVYRLAPALRHPRLGPEAVLRILRLAGRNKPLGHRLLEARAGKGAVCSTRMSAIGG